MTTTQKITALRKKLSARQKQLEKFSEKISKDKAKEKALKKEIEGITEEISELETKELTEVLNTSGITAADVHNAIIAGLIKPSAESANTVTKADISAEKEESENEISSS